MVVVGVGVAAAGAWDPSVAPGSEVGRVGLGVSSEEAIWAGVGVFEGVGAGVGVSVGLPPAHPASRTAAMGMTTRAALMDLILPARWRLCTVVPETAVALGTGSDEIDGR